MLFTHNVWPVRLNIFKMVYRQYRKSTCRWSFLDIAGNFMNLHEKIKYTFYFLMQPSFKPHSAALQQYTHLSFMESIHTDTLSIRPLNINQLVTNIISTNSLPSTGLLIYIFRNYNHQQQQYVFIFTTALKICFCCAHDYK